jgi:hypothetical protein
MAHTTLTSQPIARAPTAITTSAPGALRRQRILTIWTLHPNAAMTGGGFLHSRRLCLQKHTLPMGTLSHPPRSPIPPLWASQSLHLVQLTLTIPPCLSTKQRLPSSITHNPFQRHTLLANKHRQQSSTFGTVVVAEMDLIVPNTAVHALTATDGDAETVKSRQNLRRGSEYIFNR